jgi:PPOX class probable FMN-dependent enzyme
MTRINSLEELRQHYGPTHEGASKKVLRKLYVHCRRFIELAPLLCLGTSAAGGADVTPRGDAPGSVLVLDELTIAIPDWPGNNRLDSLRNILENPHVGILFLVPGLTETLRVNGEAVLSADPELLSRWEVAHGGKRPKIAIVVTIREVFLHCGKALLRSKLWNEDYKIAKGTLPSFAQMLKDQTAMQYSVADIDNALEKAYRDTLWCE